MDFHRERNTSLKFNLHGFGMKQPTEWLLRSHRQTIMLSVIFNCFLYYGLEAEVLKKAESFSGSCSVLGLWLRFCSPFRNSLNEFG